MKKIINGKKYNTETATEHATYWSSYNTSDFSWYAETLYEKRTGEFFIYGYGNAMSKYSEATGTNSWGGSEKIIPITEEQARKWVERTQDGDTYEEIFGEVEE